MSKDIAVLQKAREHVMKQLDRYFEGEVTAEATSQIAYSGGQVAYITAIKHDVERVAA